MKKATSVLVIMVFTLLLSACTNRSKNQAQEENQQQIQEKDEESAQNQEQKYLKEEPQEFQEQEQGQLQKQDSQKEGKIYRNGQYSFTLDFPAGWEQLQTKNRQVNWGDPGTSDSIDFGLPDQDSLFNIIILSKEQWRNFENYNFPKPTYLGENEQYVFGYGLAHDAANQEIVERMKEVKEIVETFQFDQ